jgi:hypothetical protein
LKIVELGIIVWYLAKHGETDLNEFTYRIIPLVEDFDDETDLQDYMLSSKWVKRKK